MSATVRRRHVTLALFVLAGVVIPITGGGGASRASESGAPAWGLTRETMSTPRVDHTATRLDGPQCRTGSPAPWCGDVLVVGGQGRAAGSTAEVFDPDDQSWTPAGRLTYGRQNHTATLLDPPFCHSGAPPHGYPCGAVLVVGGEGTDDDTEDRAYVTAELYDPARAGANRWTLVLDQEGAELHMGYARSHHAATLLPDGSVLVAGILDDGLPIQEAERYDPVDRAWRTAGFHRALSRMPTATLLPSGPPESCKSQCGKVLVVGLQRPGPGRPEQLYDPGVNIWSDTAPATRGHRSHSATLLPMTDGRVNVIVAGGAFDAVGDELYDPATNAWMLTDRGRRGAGPQAAVLVTGAACHVGPRPVQCGKVLVAGGRNSSGEPTNQAQLYDPDPPVDREEPVDEALPGAWQETAPLVTPRSAPTTTALADGRVLVVGGEAGTTALSTAELFPGVSPPLPPMPTIEPASGPTTGGTKVTIRGAGAGAVGDVRFGGIRGHEIGGDATELTARTPVHPAGTVDVTVSLSDRTVVLRFTFFDPPATLALGRWSSTGELGTPRSHHTATLLDGPACRRASPPGYCDKVVVIGGLRHAESPQGLDSVELYDPGQKTWSPGPKLPVGRWGHAATLLDGPECHERASPPAHCGKVLVTGGWAAGDGTASSDAFLFDPGGPSWLKADSLKVPHAGHTATLLASEACMETAPAPAGYPCGKVLVTGGDKTGRVAEVFDPAAGAVGRWSLTNPATLAHRGHDDALLADGKVLVNLGDGDQADGGAEVYDPATGSWTTARQDPKGSTEGEAADNEDVLARPSLPGFPLAVLDRPACARASSPPACGAVLFGLSILYDAKSDRDYDVQREDGAAQGDSGSSATVLDGPMCRAERAAGSCGRVLLVGGAATAPLAAVFVPPSGDRLESGKGLVAPSLAFGRFSHSATLLDGAACRRSPPPEWCGQVLVVGGRPQSRNAASEDFRRPALTQSELFTPSPSPAPVVTSVEPRAGSTLGDTTVMISGTGLASAAGVRFGTEPATVVQADDDQIVVRSPAQPQGSVAISLVDRAGAVVVDAGRFTYGSGTWRRCGTSEASPRCPDDLSDGRVGHTATRLDGPACRRSTPPAYCGAVLVAGGSADRFFSSPLASAEVYDPDTGRWLRGATGMTTPRIHHSAVLLDGPECQTAVTPPHCGKVLVAGGWAVGRQPVHTAAPRNLLHAVSSAELYDPATGVWTPTGAMATPRFSFTATLLDGSRCSGGARPDWCGRVLVAGGTQQDFDREPLVGAEVYDPLTGVWTTTAPLDSCTDSHSCVARTSHTATALPDGRVLVAGGLGPTRPPFPDPGMLPPASQIVGDDPAGSDRPAQVEEMVESIRRCTIARGECPILALASAAVFDPGSGTWRPTGSMGVARFAHTASLLSGSACGHASPPNWCGRVLTVGGSLTLVDNSDATEEYDPATGAWAPRMPLLRARGGHTATVLPNGDVLVTGSGRHFREIGDFEEPASHAVAELYRPSTQKWTETDWAGQAKGGHTATLLDGRDCRSYPRPPFCGTVLIAGGLGDAPSSGQARPQKAVELYLPAPEVEAVTPARAPSAGGTTVAIVGTDLDRAREVAFGTTRAVGFSAESPSRLVATVPPHAVAGVQLAVVSDGGTSARLAGDTRSAFSFLGAPGRVRDLAARPLSASTVELSFETPDDGSGNARATLFVVKHSDAPIETDEDFAAAVALCPGGVCTVAQAERVVLAVNELTATTTYHFALQAVNDVGILGPRSASVFVTTLPAAGACPEGAPPGPGQRSYAGGRYHLIGGPAGAVVDGAAALYSWFDLGAGGVYTTHAPNEPLRPGRGYWMFSFCDSVIGIGGDNAGVTLPLGGYHASMVGNPSATHARLTGQDFAARWDPDSNSGAGGYVLSGYREAQPLVAGEGAWVFSYDDTAVTIHP